VGLFGKEEPEPATVLDKPLRCAVCGNEGFYKRDAQLHTAGMTFLKLEWAQPTCTCLVCSMCGYIHWFMPGA
jgi:predicted nucleic-acid-binding Zn-ribbon protein